MRGIKIYSVKVLPGGLVSMAGWYKRIVVALLSLVMLVAGFSWCASQVSGWLFVSNPVREAEVAVCLNSSAARVDKVVALYRQGHVARILVTYPSTRAKAVKAGAPEQIVLNLDGGFTSTFEEAYHVLQFLRQQDIRSAIIVSDPWHMYRARWTYEYLTDGDDLSLTYVASGPPPGEAWWETPKGRLQVLNEVPKVMYYWVAHGLLGVTSDPPWIIALEKWYSDLLKDKLKVKSRSLRCAPLT